MEQGEDEPFRNTRLHAMVLLVTPHWPTKPITLGADVDAEIRDKHSRDNSITPPTTDENDIVLDASLEAEVTDKQAEVVKDTLQDRSELMEVPTHLVLPSQSVT